MFKIALELSRHDQAWDEMATKFLEHFLSIAQAMNTFGSQDMSLWHEDDGFFYDVLVNPDGEAQHMRVRSMVGLLPMLGATEVPSLDRRRDCPDVTAGCAGCSAADRTWCGPLLSGPAGRATTCC